MPFYEAWGWTVEEGTARFRMLEFISNHYIFNSLITGDWEIFWDATHHLVLPAIAVLLFSRGSNYEAWFVVLFVPAVVALGLAVFVPNDWHQCLRSVTLAATGLVLLLCLIGFS